MEAPYHETLLAFDALEEMERIDGLLRDYELVLAAIRPRQEAEQLNRDYSSTIARLRFDPDAKPLSRQFSQAELDDAAQRIIQGIQWRKVDPPVS